MKIDETIYNEYANFKIENNEFLKKLEEEANDIFYTFKDVLEVIEFLYNMLVDDENYGEEQDVVFKTGYLHVLNVIVDLKNLLEDVYNNDYKKMNNHASEINLLLNTYEFQDEIKELEIDKTPLIEELLNYDQKIYELIKNKQLVDESLYERLNYLVSAIFEDLKIEFISINNIFLEISEQLKLF